MGYQRCRDRISSFYGLEYFSVLELYHLIYKKKNNEENVLRFIKQTKINKQSWGEIDKHKSHHEAKTVQEWIELYRNFVFFSIKLYS